MFYHNLTVDSVVKFFKNKPILSDVYLCCETNEIIGIFGKNGSGKSTLLKIIFGTETSQNKFIKIDNLVSKKLYLKNNELSFLTQQNFIPKYLLVSKSIFLFVDNEIRNKFYDDDEIINLIKHKKIRQLSGGELRYLEIKLILFSKTKFSFLDEPFSGLSPLQIEKVKKIICEVSKRKGIILIDHQYQNVLDISTKLYVIRDGKTTLLSNSKQLIDYGYLPKE